MSTPQKKSNATIMPIPDVNMASDSKDEQVVDLEAVATEAGAKLKKDLVDVKAWNNKITWKKQEWVDQKEVERKHEEDMDAAAAKKKVDEDAKKKGLVQPPVVSTCLLLEGWRANLVSSLGRLCFLGMRRQGRPSTR